MHQPPFQSEEVIGITYHGVAQTTIGVTYHAVPHQKIRIMCHARIMYHGGHYLNENL